MNVDHTVSICGQASLNQLIINSDVLGVERSANLIADQILPTNWETKDVEPIVVDEMLHLSGTVGIALGCQWWCDTRCGVRSLCVTATEIKTGDVDTS